jgi:hypothetical protein
VGYKKRPASDPVVKARRKKEAARQAAVRAAKKAVTAQLTADLKLVEPPTLTAAIASDFVKLLSAGVPGADALAYFAPSHAAFSQQAKGEWLDAWMADPLVLKAVNEWNHGAWETLSEDRRVELALGLATNQMAHFLYTNAYHTVSGADLGKWSEARKALQARIDAKTGTGESAYEKFLKSLLANTAASGPPQLALVKK